jgi:hypothetical protein
MILVVSTSNLLLLLYELAPRGYVCVYLHKVCLCSMPALHWGLCGVWLVVGWLVVRVRRLRATQTFELRAPRGALAINLSH